MPRDDEFDAPPFARPMTFLHAAAWTIALGLVGDLVITFTESARPGASVDLVNIVASRTLAASLFLFAMLRVHEPEASIRDVLAVRKVSPVVAVLAALAGGLLSPGVSFIDDVIYKRFPLGQEESDFLEKVTTATTKGQQIVLFVSLVLVIPLSEELFFRGAVFRGLRRGRAEGMAVLGSAMLYGLSHVNLRALPAGLALGLLASWLRGRSGSIVPALLASVAMTAVPLAPEMLGRGEMTVGWRVALGAGVGAALSWWLAALVLARDPSAERGRLLDA